MPQVAEVESRKLQDLTSIYQCCIECVLAPRQFAMQIVHMCTQSNSLLKLEGCAHFSSSLAEIHARWLRSPTPLQFVLRVATNCTVLQIKRVCLPNNNLF